MAEDLCLHIKYISVALNIKNDIIEKRYIGNNKLNNTHPNYRQNYYVFLKPAK